MSEVKRYDCTNGKAQHCYGCYQMTESAEGDYVSSADFDAQRLRADTAEAERDTLQQELCKRAGDIGRLTGERDAAEQRNDRLAVLLGRADDFMYIMTGSEPEKHLNKNWEAAIEVLRGEIAAALNPKPEAGSHE